MFEIDLKETFPSLSRSPIVEAVIGITARAVSDWEELAIAEEFRQRLPDYPNVQSQREIRHEINFMDDAQPKQPVNISDWHGLRCTSADKLHIAQFNRDGFTFSRLQQYQSWGHFSQEGMRLWKVYNLITQPSEIQRIGLRFINRIEFPQIDMKLEEFLENPPRPPRGMEVPFVGFMHHNTLTIPGQIYGVNVIQTIQPPHAVSGFWGVILDIDVFTTEPGISHELIEQHLAKMRWLKNKVFFGSITPKTLEMIK